MWCNGSSYGRVEELFQPLLSEGGTLHEAHHIVPKKRSSQSGALLGGNSVVRVAAPLPISFINLGASEDDGGITAMMTDLLYPFLCDVLK